MESYIVIDRIHWRDADLDIGDTFSFDTDEFDNMHGSRYTVINRDGHKHMCIKCRSYVMKDLTTMDISWKGKIILNRKWNHE